MSRLDAERLAAGAWGIVHAALESATKGLSNSLPPPAEISAIREVERALGRPFPDVALAMYLVHDGLGPPYRVRGMPGSSYLLSLSEALRWWRELTGVLREGWFAELHVATYGPVRPVWWSNLWLPIAGDGAGNHYCLDFDPAPGGSVGQVVSFWHEDGDRAVEARNLAEYLTQLDLQEWAIEKRI